MPNKPLSPAEKESYEERAFMEFDGKLPRKEGEKLAHEDVLRQRDKKSLNT